ncbi:hypothetical protein MRX96_005089 [Rhipicephalus microplus]
MFRAGVFPAEATKSSPPPWIILKLALMYIYSVHIVSNAIAGSIRTSSLSYIIETLTYTTRSLVSTITTTYFVVKASELKLITDELDAVRRSPADHVTR